MARRGARGTELVPKAARPAEPGENIRASLLPYPGCLIRAALPGSDRLSARPFSVRLGSLKTV
jgi:hypothetical protein